MVWRYQYMPALVLCHHCYLPAAMYTGCQTEQHIQMIMICTLDGVRLREFLQLCAVLGSLPAADCMQSAQLDLLALLICDGASFGLPVGVLLSPDLPLPLFPPRQLCGQKVMLLCKIMAISLCAEHVSKICLTKQVLCSGFPSWH